MANVNCTVYFRENGTRRMYSIAQAKGREGSNGIRWYEGKRQRPKIIGHYSAATAAKLRKELELRKAASPKANSTVLAEISTTLDDAIQTFVREREHLNPASARRLNLELDLFKQRLVRHSCRNRHAKTSSHTASGTRNMVVRTIRLPCVLLAYSPSG